MGQQVVDCDLLSYFLVGISGQMFGNWIIIGEFASLGQLSNGHRSKHLVHGAEIELGVDAVGHLIGPAGQPIGTLEDRLAILGNEYRAGELLLGHQFLDKCFDLGNELGVIKLCCGWWWRRATLRGQENGGEEYQTEESEGDWMPAAFLLTP